MSSEAPKIDLEFYPSQYAALDTDANEILAGGSKGGGKSFLLRWAALLFCLYVPGLQVYFFRRKYKDLLSNHVYGPEGYLAILEPFVKAGKASINLSDNRIDFYHENGKTSRIFLRHMNHDQDRENYRGIEAHLLIFDELSHFTQVVYNFMRTHVRLGGHVINYDEVRTHLPFVRDGYFPRILSGTNPGGIGHQWIKKAFIDSSSPNTVWTTPPSEGGMRRLYVPSVVTDNKKMLENDPGYADRIRGMGGPLMKAFLEGDWNITGEGAIDDVWDDAIHVIEPVIVPSNCVILRVLDYGTFHPSAIIYVMVTPKEPVYYENGEETGFVEGSLVVLKEIYNWNGTENQGNRMSAHDVGRQMADFEARVEWAHNIVNGPADNQINRNTGHGQTVHQLMVDGYNQRMIEVTKEYPDFKWTMNVDLLFSRADQSPNSKATGLIVLRSFLSGAVDRKSRGLYFVETCTQCLRTLPNIPRSESRPEETDEKAEDHLFDCVRYACLHQRGTFERINIVGI